MRPPSLTTILLILCAPMQGTAFTIAPTLFHNCLIPYRTSILGRDSKLCMSLKPAAIPLLDSGKALARSGELLIEATTAMGIYGGGLSAAGAGLRNSGDCIAQAAASCRFKTAAELVCDELREAATCLTEGSEKLKLAVEEAEDEDPALASRIESTVVPMRSAGTALEAAGAGIMKKSPMKEVGESLQEGGASLDELSSAVLSLAEDREEVRLSSQRMSFAASKMVEAGNNLCGIAKPKPKGKAWLKGG